MFSFFTNISYSLVVVTRRRRCLPTWINSTMASSLVCYCQACWFCIQRCCCCYYCWPTCIKSSTNIRFSCRYSVVVVVYKPVSTLQQQQQQQQQQQLNKNNNSPQLSLSLFSLLLLLLLFTNLYQLSNGHLPFSGHCCCCTRSRRQRTVGHDGRTTWYMCRGYGWRCNH